TPRLAVEGRPDTDDRDATAGWNEACACGNAIHREPGPRTGPGCVLAGCHGRAGRYAITPWNGSRRPRACISAGVAPHRLFLRKDQGPEEHSIRRPGNVHGPVCNRE